MSTYPPEVIYRNSTNYTLQLHAFSVGFSISLIAYNQAMADTPDQRLKISQPWHGSIFLSGRFGTGKTTAAVMRLTEMIRVGIQPSSILVLVPQRSLAAPYTQALQNIENLHGTQVTILTMGGLARRMVSLYWPLVSDLAGFHRPELPPSFLTLESAQYFMAHLVEPLFDQGYFSSVSLERNRIYSQILDNLNKSAIFRFPYTQIGERLKSAWIGTSEQLNIYEDVQQCVNLFRSFCLANNLLDYSLQIEIFRSLIWPSKLLRQNLFTTFRHLIYDNCEEDPPFAHDIVREWLPELESALIIYDAEAGFRSFLGADPQSAMTLSSNCREQIQLVEPLINSQALLDLSRAIFQQGKVSENPTLTKNTMIMPEENLQFFPQMLDWTAEKIKQLVDEGTQPGQIAILAPFMSDMLRFSIANRLEKLGISYQSSRPSRALRDEPAVQCLLSLAALAHPDWQMLPSPSDLAYALVTSILDMDLVRAQLLVENLYQPNKETLLLADFSALKAPLRERVSYRLGEKFEILRRWIENSRNEPALDSFFSQLFSEVLSQPGFRFHHDIDAGQLTSNLIESVQKFRLAIGYMAEDQEFMLGKEYLTMVKNGLIAALYTNARKSEMQDAVTISPAYTFLIQNKPVDYQFWIDISSPSWYERLDQPLTHPYVLSNHWAVGKKWTAEDEISLSRETLQIITSGLIARCRKAIFLGLSNLNESGSENRGLLLQLIQNMLIRERYD